MISLSALLARGQVSSLHIHIKGDHKDISKVNYNRRPAGKEAAMKEIGKVVLYLQQNGYLLATTDSIYSEGTELNADITPGEQFKLARLRMGNLDPNLASKIGISEKLYFDKPFRYQDVARSFEKIINYYENNGYPFASVKLDSVTVEGNTVSGVMQVQKHKFYRIDSLRVIGSAKVNKSFLTRYLGLREKMAYNESAIAAISQKIRQLPFVSEKQPPEARLSDRNNKLLLFLDKKEASQFDGIIGVLPDNNTKKTTITGDIKLKLVNGVFHNGETFDLEWRRLQSQTQDFHGRIIYPYLFGSPIGSDYALKIYRRDTTFIDVNHNIGLQYYFSGLNNFRLFYKQRNTNLISTSGLEFITTLPEYADIVTRSYGMGLHLEKLDYRFNPRKGIATNLSVQTGNRTVKKNPLVNEVAYNGLLLNSVQYQFESTFSAFVPVYRNNIIRIGIQAASVFGNSKVFRNELFRIGGLKTLRGFDEESIFASTYVIPTLEYRFLFSENSNLIVFAEGAWYENIAGKTYVKDTPVSLGAGMNFETKAGILGMHYAIGNQFGNGFDPRSGKIHLGLTALF